MSAAIDEENPYALPVEGNVKDMSSNTMTEYALPATQDGSLLAEAQDHVSAPVLQMPIEKSVSPPFPVVSPDMPTSAGWKEDSRNVWAVAGFILGLSSIFLGIFMAIPIIGIIGSILGMKSPKYRTLSIVGLVLACIGLVLSLIIGTFLFLALIATLSSSYPAAS